MYIDESFKTFATSKLASGPLAYRLIYYDIFYKQNTQCSHGRHSALIHDSYRCLPRSRGRFGSVVPFPTQREGGKWTGSGPHRQGRVERNKNRSVTCCISI